MPELSTLLLFAAAAISINLTPGPDMLYVMARSIEQGRRAGIISALGLSVGYVVHTLLAASGVAAVLLTYPAAYGVIRLIGAAYLVYLGVRTLRAGDPEAVGAAAGPTSLAHAGWPVIFRQGALTSTLNPSIAVFFLAFLPQFVMPEQGAVVGQIVILGLLFNATATTTHTVIALLTGTAGNWLRTWAGAGRWQRLFSGAVLIFLGARVLLQF